MRKPAAKQGDRIVSEMDFHKVILTNGAPALWPHRFDGVLRDRLSPNVYIMGRPAAVVGSGAENFPHHIVKPPVNRFVPPEPTNRGTVAKGSSTVFINNESAARDRDEARTCGHPDAPAGRVVASGSVYIG